MMIKHTAQCPLVIAPEGCKPSQKPLVVPKKTARRNAVLSLTHHLQRCPR
jgi:hypothetical protein